VYTPRRSIECPSRSRESYSPAIPIVAAAKEAGVLLAIVDKGYGVAQVRMALEKALKRVG
jgi:hypothetical protein